jgi:hypothetical protein
MIKSLLKPSKLCALDPCIVIWLGNDRRQLRISMRSLPNSTSRRPCTSVSSSNKEKHPSMMKLHGQPATMITSAVTPSKCTTSTPKAVGHRRTRKRTLGHLCKKEIIGPSLKDQISTISEVACQAEAAVTAKAHSHTSLRIACTMVVTLTIAQKIAPSSSNPKEK